LNLREADSQGYPLVDIGRLPRNSSETSDGGVGPIRAARRRSDSVTLLSNLIYYLFIYLLEGGTKLGGSILPKVADYSAVIGDVGLCGTDICFEDGRPQPSKVLSGRISPRACLLQKDICRA
jgi:hypothetical protein